ncbi:MAG: N-acetylglucosamine-6-phosphate deacetylase [Clostridia bacterium]|nr:N-acetylglucosamine-6-phosphate deacetylase [Clostridia bacterium]
MKAIKNGKIILEDEILDGKALLLSDRIEGIVDEGEIPEGAAVIDAEGGYVSPGLIELHIHGYLGKDVCDASEESIRIISKGLLENGVTGFLPTTMTVDMEVIKGAIESVRSLMAESRTPEFDGTVLLGVHAEGPFISESKKGAQDPRFILKPDADFVKANSDVIRVITLAPEEDDADFSAIRRISAETDVVVSMGHTSADYNTAMAGVEAGVRHATHLFNAMTPLTHRGPGVVGAALKSDKVSTELIVDTYHVNSALFDIVYKLKGRKLCFITDCLPAGGLPEGEYTLGGAKIIYKDNICKLEDGTIAGSVLKLNKGIWNVYTNSDIPLHECVNCASLNPATTLGIQDNKGSIKVGKDADIVILDNEFNVKKTIIGGNIKYEA